MSRRYVIDVEVNRTSGKFVSGDAIDEAIVDVLEGSDPGDISPEDSEYDILSWEVATYDDGGKSSKSAKKASAEHEWLETLYYWLVDLDRLPADETEGVIKALKRAVGPLGRTLGK